MTVLAKVLTFDSPTATGLQDIHTVGFPVKALIPFVNPATADGVDVGAHACIGFATGPTARKAVAVRQRDAQVGARANHLHANLALMGFQNGTVATQFEADLAQMFSDGFQLNWLKAPGTVQKMHAFAIGGTSITNAAAGEFLSRQQSQGPGTQQIEVGFLPDSFLLLSANDNLALGVFGNNVQLTLGAASSPTARGSCSIFATDSATPTAVKVYQRTDKIFAALTPSGTAEADLVSFDPAAGAFTGGVTILWSALFSNPTHIFWLALKGATVKVGAETQRATAGSKTTGGLGASPKGLFVFGTGRPAASTVDASQMKLSVGASDGVAAASIWLESVDAVSPSRAQFASLSNRILRHAHYNAVVEAEAAAPVFDPAGSFSLPWDVPSGIFDGALREFIYVAFGEVTPPPVFTGNPTITGTAQVGATLTYHAGTANPDGARTIRWLRETTPGGAYQPILGATAATYTIPQTENGTPMTGLKIEVEETATNAGGQAVATSAATAAVTAAAVPVNTAPPAITNGAGTLHVNEQANATAGTWNGTYTITEQWWQADNAAFTTNPAPISGAMSLSRVMAAAQQGKYIQLRETADNQGTQTTASSAVFGPVLAAPGGAPTNTVLPTITGDPTEDGAVAIGDGTWTGSPSLTRQLQRSAPGDSSSGWVDIPGATGSTYTQVGADDDRYLRVRVTGTNGSGTYVATSAVFGPVAPPDDMIGG